MDGDVQYSNWMSNWKQWKTKWIDSDDIVNIFTICAIPPGKHYTYSTHLDFAALLNSAIGLTNVNRAGTIMLKLKRGVDPEINISSGKLSVDKNNEYLNVCDRFGFIEFSLHFFTRKEILQVAYSLEKMGFGVLHDSGIVCSTTYTTNIKPPKKMPNRDDPVWLYIEY